MATWTTEKDEMADEIAWKVYGDRPEGLTALLNANPILAKQPPMLPAGLVLTLPVLPEEEPPEVPLVRLFD